MNLVLKIVSRVLIAAIALLVLSFCGDYLVAKYRVSKNPSGSLEAVKIQPMYIIPHKDSRAEYVFGDPQTQTCVHSIFPHFGYSPCWYVKKNTQPVISGFVYPDRRLVTQRPKFVSARRETVPNVPWYPRPQCAARLSHVSTKSIATHVE